MVQPVTKSYLTQHVRRALTPRLRIDAGINKRELDISQAVGARKKIERLKNKTDLAIANARQFVVCHAGNVAAIEFVAPGTGRIETAEHVHKGRFATTTGPHDCEVLVAVYLQRHAA